MQIKNIIPRQILDSRGNPTIEVDLTFKDGSFGRASVPSGASTGSREAVELRDGGLDFHGQAVQKAITHIYSVVLPSLANHKFESLKEFDEHLIKLDGTKNKSLLGANAILALSIAFAKAEAGSTPLYEYFAKQDDRSDRFSLPTPMFNVINGGKHAEKSADIQEFMIVPTGLDTFSKKLQAGSEIFHTLKKIISTRGFATTVGDEGGFALPPHQSNTDAIELIIEATEEAGYKAGAEVKISLDVAASELFDDESYNFKSESKKFTSDELIDYYSSVIKKYPILSIEDGLDENDWSSWSHMQSLIGDKVLLVGDDLLVTNTKYIQKAIDEKACNAVLIKPNQIGTLTETIEAVQLAHSNDLTTIMSHRSGETEDTTIADLAVGLGCKYIKSGSLSRSERLAKYNQLLRIEELLKKS
ncbi:phosphopyruvate hydratase [Candidatus Nomurabacteria bacterium]|nr:phosphopyruvate hydratase [Candidatus Nomurabacteria bacterium]